MAQRRTEEGMRRPRCGYSGVLETRYPLNPSKSKCIVVGLDLERELAPFVSIENGQGLGVVLTCDELKQLFDPAWLLKAADHMRCPSYKVRTLYTSRHEVRCSMMDGNKPTITITKLEGDGAFTFLGEATWDGLLRVERLVQHALDELIKISATDSIKAVCQLVLNLAWDCSTHHCRDFASIMNRLKDPDILSAVEAALQLSLPQTRIKREMISIYPEMTACLILQAMKAGVRDLFPKETAV